MTSHFTGALCQMNGV